MNCSTYAGREIARARAFESVWDHELEDVFADVARYYDRANVFATLGLLNNLRGRFLATVAVKPNDKVLDVCAGTNVIGIGLLQREPTLRVQAIDRSRAMQEVGGAAARSQGLHIDSSIDDVHRSQAAALRCRRYFTDAIRMFYSTEELSHLLGELGYADVAGKSVLFGTVAFHKARKA